MTRAHRAGLTVALTLLVLGGGRAEAQAVPESEETPEAETAAPQPPTVGSSVVFLAPDEVRAEWTAALQIELSPTGDRVIPAAPVEGATVLLRDAAAQQMAILAGARAAARVEGQTLRVIAADAERARATPFAAEADARTVALILVSLLDERDAPGAVLPPPPPPPAPETPAPAAVSQAVDEESPTPPEEAAAESPWPQFSFRVGTGGFALLNDSRFIGGGMLRAGMGLRARYFEGAMLVDGGLMLDSLPNVGSELQPMVRGCLEAGAAIPTSDSIAFHVGGRGCAGYAELRFVDRFDPGFPFAFDQTGWLLSVGGYVGVSFALSDWSRLYVRADVEAATVQASMHDGEVFPVLSTIFSFF